MKYGIIFFISLFANVALGAADYTISQGAPAALHEKPSDKSAVTTLLDPGMRVSVDDSTQHHGFVLVNPGNQDPGWISAKRLEPPIEQTGGAASTMKVPSFMARIKTSLGFAEPVELNKTPTVPTGRRDQIIGQYSQLQGAYLQLQQQRQQATFILGVITLLIGIVIGLWINKYRYNRNRW